MLNTRKTIFFASLLCIVKGNPCWPCVCQDSTLRCKGELVNHIITKPFWLNRIQTVILDHTSIYSIPSFSNFPVLRRLKLQGNIYLRCNMLKYISSSIIVTHDMDCENKTLSTVSQLDLTTKDPSVLIIYRNLTTPIQRSLSKTSTKDWYTYINITDNTRSELIAHNNITSNTTNEWINPNTMKMNLESTAMEIPFNKSVHKSTNYTFIHIHSLDTQALTSSFTQKPETTNYSTYKHLNDILISCVILLLMICIALIIGLYIWYKKQHFRIIDSGNTYIFFYYFFFFFFFKKKFFF
jgi:hypothetical protein